MRVLLDTCALIWTVSAPRKLSDKARSAIESSEAAVHYSPMSCAEVARSAERRRIQVDPHWKVWFRHHVELNGWEEVTINLDIVEEAHSLPGPFHRDPIDRILVATARLHGLHIVTSDEKILKYPHVHSIW